jgi:hypothetical protein
LSHPWFDATIGLQKTCTVVPKQVSYVSAFNILDTKSVQLDTWPLMPDVM